MPALKHHQFQFLLRFPAKYEQEWIRRSHFRGWPFDDTDAYIDEYLQPQDYWYNSFDVQTVLLVYSVPFHLLKHMRTVHNYSRLISRLGSVRKDSINLNMEWFWKCTCNKTQIIPSLEALSQVRALRCVFYQMNNETEIISNPTQLNLYYHLRSLTFRDKRDRPLKDSQYYSPLEIILSVSSHLSHLDVSWNDLSRCSGTYTMITHVHLYLRCGDHSRVDVERLERLIPRVNYLAFGGHQLVREKAMIDFVFRLLVDNNYFSQVILLQINKKGNVKIKPKVKVATEEAIHRFQLSTPIRTQFSYHNQLDIWLR